MLPTRMPGRHAFAVKALYFAFPPGQALGNNRAFKIAGAAAHIAGWFAEGNGLSRCGHAVFVPYLFQQV